MNHNEACDILGVDSGAAKENIKAAYYNICKACHPDNTGGVASEYFYRANEAFNFLMDEEPAPVVYTRPGRVIGSGASYKYNHNDYRKRQKRYREEQEAKKQADSILLAGRAKELEQQRQKKKEQEILDKIRWIRLAEIIHSTIESDKKRMEDRDSL